MAKMSPPHSSATVDVSDDNVQRFKEAGWTEAKSSSTTKKSTSSGASSSKSSDKK